MDSQKLFDAAVDELADHIGPMASFVVEGIFAKANIPLNGTLQKHQAFIVTTLLRAELPKNIDSYAAVKRIEAKART